jgi:hypothetical protein
MPPAPAGFAVGETHGMLLRPENEIQVSSDGCAWTSLYASLQLEVRSRTFAAVDDQLLMQAFSGCPPQGMDQSGMKSRTKRGEK